MEETNMNKPQVTDAAAKVSGVTVQGTVKTFDRNKRFGFIAQEGGKEVFVHEEALLDGITIAAGDRVSFEVTESPRGPRAASVRKL